MSTFQLYILAADCDFYEGPCESLVVPFMKGQYGILAHHSNMIGAIVPGELSYKVPGEEVKTAIVSSGLVKIENNEVVILTDSAEHPDEIDANKAKRAAAEAKEALLQRKSITEYRSAQAALARAVGRLRSRDHNENR